MKNTIAKLALATTLVASPVMVGGASNAETPSDTDTSTSLRYWTETTSVDGTDIVLIFVQDGDKLYYHALRNEYIDSSSSSTSFLGYNYNWTETSIDELDLKNLNK